MRKRGNEERNGEKRETGRRNTEMNEYKFRTMNAVWRYKYFYVTLVALIPASVEAQTNQVESSGTYLREAMTELQELNVPAAIVDVYHPSPDVHYRNSFYQERDEGSSPIQRINSDARPNSTQKDRNQILQGFSIFPTDNERIDSLDPADSGTISQYQYQYQGRVPTVTKVREPESLGFTRAQLAAMYKNALEKGSAIKLSSLKNSIASGALPHVTDTRVEFPSIKQPLYNYYFFPLKTFASELNRDNGYKTITPSSAIENAAATQTTQVELSNPLFVAISTFVTMAIVFMMGVLFLPKFTQYDSIRGRESQDDFFHLSNMVANAIDRYDLLQKVGKRDFDRSR